MATAIASFVGTSFGGYKIFKSGTGRLRDLKWKRGQGRVQT